MREALTRLAAEGLVGAVLAVVLGVRALEAGGVRLHYGLAEAGIFVLLAAAVAGLIGGVIMVYVFGAFGFVGVQGMEFGAAMLSMAVFVPGDLTKLVIAVLLCTGLWKAYPRAFR